MNDPQLPYWTVEVVQRTTSVSVKISNVPLFPLLGSSQILQQEATKFLYPKLLSTETIDCDCVNITCDNVYWFRSSSNFNTVQYIGRCNNADRAYHGVGVEAARFLLNRKNSMSFTLRIVKVTEKDAGIYSCVLKDRKNTEMWKPGTVLQPGGLYAEISSASFTAVKYQV